MNTHFSSNHLCNSYLEAIGKHKLLTAAEEIDLGRRVRGGESGARTRMIESNLRLVVRIAGGYVGFGMAFEDLISEGNLGLIRAVELFDPERGVRFSSYASLWIKQAIRRGLTERSRTIRLPAHVIDKLFKINRTAARLSVPMGREPTDSELGSAMGMPESRVRSVRQAVRPLRSLHETVDEEDGELELMTVLADETTARPDQAVTDCNLRVCLERLLPTLPHRERDVLLSRFGLDGREPQTLEQISHRLGVTRERVRQIQNAAIAMLRKGFMALDRPVLKPCRDRVASKSRMPASFELNAMAG